MTSLTADAVVFSEDRAGKATHVLLVRREREPFQGHWALPGGFVNENEDLADAARRELLEETGLEVGKIWQVGAFGRPGRDPRGHVVSVAFFGIVSEVPSVLGADDAAEAQWVPLDLAREQHNSRLAFDHIDIIERAWMIYSGTQ